MLCKYVCICLMFINNTNNTPNLMLVKSIDHILVSNEFDSDPGWIL